jgi:hypothetical protein
MEEKLAGPGKTKPRVIICLWKLASGIEARWGRRAHGLG